MIEKYPDLESLQSEAIELDRRGSELKRKGLASSIQEGVDLEVLKEKSIKKAKNELSPTEQKRDEKSGEAYYFNPEDEFNTEIYLEFLRRRDLKIEQAAKRNLSGKKFSSREDYLQALETEIHELKYFPVFFISAPHIGEGVSGVFPGEPTPLMYATAVLDRYLRTDTFPAASSPEVTAVMNPDQFSDEFIQNLIERVKREKPRVVGISNTSEGHYFAIEIAKIIKMYSPDTLVILGGSHEDGLNADAYLCSKLLSSEESVTAIKSQSTLEDKKSRGVVDMVVAGDAPYALAEIFKFIANNRDKNNNEIIENILKNRGIFKQIEGSGSLTVKGLQGETVAVSLSGTPLDWNKLPFMFRGRLTRENRFSLFDNKKTAHVMTQMGCKYGCGFCMESLNGDLYPINRFRQPSTQKTSRELEILVKDYGYEAVFFDDSTFTQSPRKTEELLDEIISLQEREVRFEWACQTAFADIPRRDFLEKMKKGGCTYIYFGFEQLEEAVEGRRKQVDPRQVEKVLLWCKELGIRTGVSLQFGLAGLGEYKRTIDYIAGLYDDGLVSKNSIAININTPYPGTREWLEMENRPDFSQNLRRHPRFESAHQLSNLTMEKVNEIYEYARTKLNDGLIGVEYSNQEIQAHLERYSGKFNQDFYFDSSQYQKFLEGKLDGGLHLNHASISNHPGEVGEIEEAASQLSKREKERLFESARDRAAELVGVERSGVIFARNTTEAMALIVKLIELTKGDHVVLTDAENPSIARLFEVNMDHGNPEGDDGWSAYPTFYHQRGKRYGKTLPELTGVNTETISVVEENLDDIYRNIESSLTPDTKCFVISHVIRDTGEELPVKDICQFVKDAKKRINPDDPEIFVIVDGAQALGNLPYVDFKDIGCDAYVGTPHKTMASTPVGLGFFDSTNPRIRKRIEKLSGLFWQDQQVVLSGMFDPDLRVEPNVPDSLDYRDLLGFNLALDRLKAAGYEKGDFSKINEKRRELKDTFRNMIHKIVADLGLEIAEVKDGSDFIYSFTVLGINNRELAQELSNRGIFVSYIDRTKLSKQKENHTGDGVIRVSFGVLNTANEIREHAIEFSEALTHVSDREYNVFAQKAEQAVVLNQPRDVISIFTWLKERTESKFAKVASLAAVLLVVLGYQILNRGHGEIKVDPDFKQVKLVELEKERDRYREFERMLEEDGYQFRVAEERGEAGLLVEKFKLLSSLDDEETLNNMLHDDDSVQLASVLGYTKEERTVLKSVYDQTGNNRLGELLSLLKDV